jgi:hypothetical protein
VLAYLSLDLPLVAQLDRFEFEHTACIGDRSAQAQEQHDVY